MSPPTRQLERLRIGPDMPTTRSRAYHEQGGDGGSRHHEEGDYEESNEDEPEEREPADDSSDGNADSSGAESDSDDEERMNMVRATSKFVYDLERLGSESRRRAVAGLTGHFDVVYCRERSGVFEFQLTDRPLIQISSAKPHCSCSEYTSKPDIACQHIYWLVDQLYDGVLSQPPSPGIPLSTDGFSPKLPRLDQLLGNNLELIAKNQDWQLAQGDEVPSHSPVKASLISRQETVRDIMSAFNTSMLPEDFRTDLAEATNRIRTPEQCVVQGDLEATLFRLAIHDDNVYGSLRKAMPAGACANIYFDKVLKRCRDILSQFDAYRRTGRKPTSVRRLEVKDVAESLRREVERIHKNLSDREPFGTEVAAEALLTILQDVSTRNIDAFEGIRWRRSAPADEDEDDRNLYEQLIGLTSMTNGLFVLDTLERLPRGVLGQYQARLNEILTKIEINRAPSAYILKLKSLIRDAGSATKHKRTGSELAGSSSKRAR